VAANALYLVTSAVTYMGVRIAKGTTLALTPAQVTSIGAGNLRAVNNPINTNGSHPASETHDTTGEAVGVSNSS
jgi:hypothetical protein